MFGGPLILLINSCCKRIIPHALIKSRLPFSCKQLFVICISFQAPPRLSSLLRIFLHNDAPVDVSAEVLNRSRQYKGQSEVSQDGEGELTWDMIVSASSSKGGGLGSALKGQPREAFFNFVRQTSKLGGDEAAVDSVTATIFEIAINEAGLQGKGVHVAGFALLHTPAFTSLVDSNSQCGFPHGFSSNLFSYTNGFLFYADSKAEVEHLVLRSVPVDVWKNLRSQASVIKDWYESQYPKSATGVTNNYGT